jgi:hypothetical protein
MSAGLSQIQTWVLRGKKKGATHVIIACDTFSHDNYPVYVMKDKSVRDEVARLEGQKMTRVDEVYSLKMSLSAQLAAPRVRNLD